MRYHIRNIAALVLAALCFVFASCHRDEPQNTVEELFRGDGTVTDIRLPYNASTSISVTKALSEASERQVNDLYVILFPVSRKLGPGSFVFDTSKPLYKRYFNSSALYPAIAEEYHYNAGYVTLDNLPTGSYILAAVANVKTCEYVNADLYEELENLDSWEEYNEVYASLNTPGSVDRVSPALLMSGIFLPEGHDVNQTDPDVFTVRSNVGLNGWIHLRRVDSYVKFAIMNEIPRCSSFEVYEWQVFNVPSDIRVSNSSSSRPTAVKNAIARTDLTTSGSATTFDFYIPEYIFTSTDASLDMIRKRSKRTADDSAWTYAPQDAPYVVFKAKMEMLVDDAETGETDIRRYADAKYIVHLGACEGSTEAERAKDFNTDRNYRFTYNIRVKGVEDIVVEAKRIEDVEYNHGSEGVVIDNVGGVTFNFDSHYGIANIALSKNDLKKMSVTLSSVVGEQAYNRDNAGNLLSSTLNTSSEDFQAFRFSFEPLSSASASYSYPVQIFRDRFVSYSETYDAGKYIEVLHNEVSQAKDENHGAAMYDLLSMLQCLPFGDGGEQYSDQALIDHLEAADQYRLAHPDQILYESKDDIPVIFTMFVNENVYYKDVNDWHEHANTVDRILRMFTSSALSTDGKSEYIRGRYNFDQKFCQTYYSDLNKEALCVEFTNEHHHKDIKNTKGPNLGAGVSVKSGWSYVNGELEGKKWDDCSDQNTPLCDHYNAFQTLYADNAVYAKQIPGSSDSNDYEAIYASLSRNRDLNRDGVIDSNEIKWFLASMEQYVQITVGGAALAKKLFSPDDYNNWNEAVDGPKGDIFANARFHFCGVETNAKFWAEEGYTVGDQSVRGAAESSTGVRSNPWELLCCRMLVDHSRVHEEEVHWDDFDDLYYYSNRENNVISMDMYRSNLHRQAITGWIDLHQNSDDVANSTFTHFQYAKADSPLIDKNAGELALMDRMHTNAYCSSYYEEEDASDLGTWRVPNQRETAVMRYLAGISFNTVPNNGAYYLSCSIWPFSSSAPRTNNGYVETIDFCTIGLNPTKSSPNGQLKTHNMRVRCVRDTDAQGNFAGDPAYGNPVNFLADSQYQSHYNDDGTLDIEFSAAMTSSLVASVSAFIGDIPATSVTGGVSGDQASAAFHFQPVSSGVTLVWQIELINGKVITYKKKYTLPARYWMISRYGVDGRYATVNLETQRTYVGRSNTGNLEEAPALDKWIVTTSTGNPVNEPVLSAGVTYYLMNAGSQNWISGPAGGNSNYMTMGSNPVSIQLQERSGYDGYFVIRLNNSTNANSNGGVDNFGTWTGIDDGSTYKFTPVVTRGPMPMQFLFDDKVIVNADGYSVHITTETDATPVLVTIDGQVASVSGSNGDYTATIVTSSPSGAEVVTTWIMSYNGENVTKTNTYYLPAKYWVIESAKDNTHKVASSIGGSTLLTADGAGNIENLSANYKWIVSRSASVIENVSEIVAGEYYYLFNVGEDYFVNELSSWGSSLSSLPVGAGTPMKVQFLDAGVDQCFSIKVFNSNTFRGWINRISDGFGYWNNTSDLRTEVGNRWRFRGVVRDVPVLDFRFAGTFEKVGDYYVSEATCNPDASLSVMIGDVPATVERNGNAVRASVAVSSVSSASPIVQWSITLGGRNYVRRQSILKPYWAFRDRDTRSKAVTVSNNVTVLRTETLDDLQLPEDCKWLLLLPGDETHTNQTPSIPTNGTYLSQTYILYNVGTGQYLGAPSNGTVNSDSFNMVSDINQALQLELGGNANGKLWRVRLNGSTGYFDRRATMSMGINGSLRHAWVFELVNP